MNLMYFIESITSLAIIFPIIVGSITVRKPYNNSYLTIFVYCLIYAVFEIIGWYCVLNHLQNHFLHNILSYLDILFWGAYFYHILETSISKRVVIALIITTLILITWSNWATGRNFNRMDSFALSIGSLSLIMMCLLFFYQLLNNLDIKNILTYSHFWITVGILIYFSGAFFTFMFAEYITFSKEKTVTQYILINAFLLFFQRIFLALGLWFSKTPPQLSPSLK